MQIEIKIDEKCVEPKMIIVTDKMTEEINELIKRISEQTPLVLVGFQNSEAAILHPDDIIRVYAANQKVYAVTDGSEYTVRLRLYEIEERLSSLGFVRISGSEIINLKKVRGFDLGFSGTICVNFQNGSTAYVSRRYVAKIKRVLGI
ncbi:MAG TPA: LytTR family DNA-binding domain-containing protein [Clostridiales bacterium]|nr:LytTR family DNA-binding domain-containing protein [Clostridiales bacterium]